MASNNYSFLATTTIPEGLTGFFFVAQKKVKKFLSPADFNVNIYHYFFFKF